MLLELEVLSHGPPAWTESQRERERETMERTPAAMRDGLTFSGGAASETDEDGSDEEVVGPGTRAPPPPPNTHTVPYSACQIGHNVSYWPR
jgi:hypothetical protein